MKKFTIIMLMAIVGLMAISCSKGKEETKMIPADEVSISGGHSNLLEIDADSVKIMLVQISDKRWDVRAIIPIKNTMPWSNVPDTDESADSYFTPSMGNLHVEFVDVNGSPLSYDLQPDWDIVKNVLSSDEYKTEEMLVQGMWSGDEYKDMKTIFDKVAGIKITNADLSRTFTSSGSVSVSSSSSSSDDDDWDIDDDKYWEQVEKAERALERQERALEKLEDALDEW